jgi:DNA-binding PadR family transcriptional regulator
MHSQIYLELKKLLDEGLIVFEIQISGEVLEKKLYSITEQGKKTFLQWLQKKSRLNPRLRTCSGYECISPLTWM